MTASLAVRPDPTPPYRILEPSARRVPLIFSSPHSGSDYPAAFVAGARLDPVTLRRSEDAFVDELFDCAPEHGAPLLKALFPRAYVDVNREAWELDPAMFDGPLPAFVNAASPRVGAGLGTVARIVANGAEIYRGKLSFDDARTRIEALYMPYHAALERLVADEVARHGRCLLVDCHSMPSVGGPADRDPGRARLDFVLGDCFGAACAPIVAETAEASLKRMGYAVGRNDPYAGGYITRHYGQPARGRHALQIEINRQLYMDELAISRSAGFQPLRTAIARLVADLARLAPSLPEGKP
ncbi:MAG: N-formylglutamate amidohydrolase [Alphaproteobacteria bacterium]|nr:N-formylglutamate amidohydrolase [Alphaproteobacteria bacterium]